MILVECNPDVALIKHLGFSRKQINHAGNKGNICNQLRKGKSLIGIMDEDVNSANPSYLGSLTQVKTSHQIEYLIDPKRHNHVIILKPDLEGWIKYACDTARIDIKAFGLPPTAKALHKVINRRLDNYEKLLKALSDKESPMLSYLQNLIQTNLL